jgi:hypothetical protein
VFEPGLFEPDPLIVLGRLAVEGLLRGDGSPNRRHPPALFCAAAPLLIVEGVRVAAAGADVPVPVARLIALRCCSNGTRSVAVGVRLVENDAAVRDDVIEEDRTWLSESRKLFELGVTGTPPRIILALRAAEGSIAT